MNSIPETACLNHQMWLTRLRFYWILLSWQLQGTEPDWTFSCFSSATLWKNSNITSSNVPLKLTITNHIIIPYLIQHYIQQFIQCHKITIYIVNLGWDPGLSSPAPVWNLTLNPAIQPAVQSLYKLSYLCWQYIIHNSHKVKTNISQIIFLFSIQKSNLKDTPQLHVKVKVKHSHNRGV